MSPQAGGPIRLKVGYKTPETLLGDTAVAATRAPNRDPVVAAAANLPSRADFEALGARLAGVEAALSRIEAKLNAVAPGQDPARPAVRRTRKPPA